MGVRWQACWTVTTGDTVDWYEYDRCLRGFSYPLRKPATADCARSPDAQAACSLPCCRGPAQHGAHTRTVPVDLDAQAACSQPRRARQLLDTLLRTARSDEASTSKALTAPRQRVSGSGRSPSSVGRHPVVFTARARSTSRRPRRVPRRGQLDSQGSSERGDPKGRGEQLFGFTHNPQHLIVDSAASRGRGGSRARQREHRSVSAQPRALGAWPRQRPPCTLPASTHICALMSRLEGVINLPPPTVPRSRKRRGCSPITHWGDLRTSSGHQVGFSGMRGGL